MFPSRWITALIALLAEFGISFTDLKLGLVVGLFALASVLILKKFKKIKAKAAVQKKNKPSLCIKI